MKRLLLVLCTLLLVTACSFDNRKTKDDQMKRYTSLIQSTLDNDKFTQTSKSFTIQAKIEKTGDVYEYEVSIDKPKYALYNLEVVAVENNSSETDDKIMPSVGVFDGPYTLIPNQSRIDAGYLKGVGVKGEVAEPELNLKLTVSWRSDSASKEHKEFFEFNLKYEAPKVEEPVKEEVVEESEETSDDTE